MITLEYVKENKKEPKLNKMFFADCKMNMQYW